MARDQQPGRKPKSWRRRLAGFIGGGIDRAFGALSTTFLLALLATIPVVQFFSLGYLLNAAGRLGKTGKLRDAFVGVRQASRVGQLVLGTWLVLLPYRLFAGLAEDAALIAADSPQHRWMKALAAVSLSLGGWAALAALSQGGRLVGFFRPLRSTRALLRQLRDGDYPAKRWQELKRFVGAFEVPRIFWLGLRGYVGALGWLALPTTLIAVGRGRGPLVLIGAVMIIGVVMVLPFLQIHFAVNDRWRSMLDIMAVRDSYARAPLAHAFAVVLLLLLALPLYLLKIELVPRDALWLPAAVFVMTIFPTKLVAAWAYHRGTRREAPRHAFFRWLGRPFMLAAAVVYAFVVFLTQYTGWHGVLGLYEHHAFLVPVPF